MALHLVSFFHCFVTIDALATISSTPYSDWIMKDDWRFSGYLPPAFLSMPSTWAGLLLTVLRNPKPGLTICGIPAIVERVLDPSYRCSYTLQDKLSVDPLSVP